MENEDQTAAEAPKDRACDDPDEWEKYSPSELARAWYQEEALYGQSDELPSAGDEDVLQAYLDAAGRGNICAQFAVGKMYLNGIMAEYNPFQAALWFSRASAADSPFASYELAKMYESGTGMKADSRMAEELFQKAYTGFLKIHERFHDPAVELKISAIRSRGYIFSDVPDGNRQAQAAVKAVTAIRPIKARKITRASRRRYRLPRRKRKHPDGIDRMELLNGKLARSRSVPCSHSDLHTRLPFPSQSAAGGSQNSGFLPNGIAPVPELGKQLPTFPQLDMEGSVQADKEYLPQCEKAPDDSDQTETTDSSITAVNGNISPESGEPLNNSSRTVIPQEKEDTSTELENHPAAVPAAVPDPPVLETAPDPNHSEAKGSVSDPKGGEEDTEQVFGYKDPQNFKDALHILENFPAEPGETCAVLNEGEVVCGQIDRIEIYQNALLISAMVEDLRRPYPVSLVGKKIFIGPECCQEAQKAAQKN